MRPNRREVVVPYRVLSHSAVVGALVPRSRPDLGARRTPGPLGLPHAARGQGRDSLDDPLNGVRPSYTVYPDACAATLRCTAPLLGFRSPSAHEGERVHVHLAVALPVARQVVDGSHAADFGVARRFSQPHGDLFLSPPSRPISGGWRSWGFSLQGFVPPTKPRRLVAAGIPSWPCSRGLREPPS